MQRALVNGQVFPLVFAGADVNARTHADVTPLMAACLAGLPEAESKNFHSFWADRQVKDTALCIVLSLPSRLRHRLVPRALTAFAAKTPPCASCSHCLRG